jgi:type IX secretion system PorP/SprF family membrane protein
MKSIIKIVLTVFISLGSYPLFAQQLPIYNLYPHMKILNNPANTADDGLVSAFLNARNQWTGIIGAPKTRTFGMQGSINDNMRIGGYLVDDKFGLINKLSANLSYAYLVKFNDNHSLTFGLSAIVNESSFNLSDASVEDYNDVVLSMSSIEGVNFDAGFGFTYHWNKFEIGLAVPQIIETKIKYTSPENDEYFFDLRRHLNVHASYLINPSNSKISLEPSVMFRTARKTPSQLDFNLLTYWNQKYWIGLGYRNSGKTWVETANGGEYQEFNLSLANSYFIISGGITILDNLMLGYAYEISNSKIYQQSNGTHEIGLTYYFGKSRKNKNDNKELAKLINDNHEAIIAQMDSLNNKIEENNNTNAKTQEQIDQLNKDLEYLKNNDIRIVKDGNETKVVEEASSGGFANPDVYVYFKTGSDELDAESITELRKLVTVMLRYPELKAKIIGHADNVGSDKTNEILSGNRAKNVYTYLTDNLIQSNRLEILAKGESMPITPNDSEEGRAINRRVEILLLK